MVKNNDGIVKHLVTALAIAVVFYIAAFAWIEHRRTAKGPWEVTFQSDREGNPQLVIRQASLGIAQTLVFQGTNVPPNLDVTQRFIEAMTNAPFGAVVFQDPTFLPGTLTLEMFGHQVEALPRVLVIDKKEVAWTPQGRINVAKRN